MKVIISHDAAFAFVQKCEGEYKEAESRSHAPRYWAVLAGRQREDDIEVDEIFVASENLRDADPHLIAEYDGPRASQFGGVYKDLRRGYQADAADLVETWRRAQAQGLDVLGSVHMHADLHNLDRPDALSPVTTHQATPIDHELFRSSAWPLNMIVYLERRGDGLCWTMTAWVPSDPASQEACDYREAPVLMTIAAKAPAHMPAAAPTQGAHHGHAD